MTVCRFWLKGTCRYGDSCRFEHTQQSQGNYGSYRGNNRYGSGRERDYRGDDTYSHYNNQNYRDGSNAQDSRKEYSRQSYGVPPSQATSSLIQEIAFSVKQEVELSERGNQWPFSCFAPIKDGCNYPGLEDTSPEELRLHAYVAQQQNNTQAYLQQLQQMQNELQTMRHLLKNPTQDILDILERMSRMTSDQKPGSESSFPSGKRNFLQGNEGPANFSFNLGAFNNNASTVPTNRFFVSANETVNTSAMIFGNQVPSFGSSTTSASVFSQFPSPVPSQPFGSQVATQGQPFGNVQMPVQNNVFGAPAVTEVHPESECFWYSKMTFTPMEVLTEDEKVEFNATSFRLGHMPTNPPPSHWCT